MNDTINSKLTITYMLSFLLKQETSKSSVQIDSKHNLKIQRTTLYSQKQ